MAAYTVPLIPLQPPWMLQQTGTSDKENEKKKKAKDRGDFRKEKRHTPIGIQSAKQ